MRKKHVLLLACLFLLCTVGVFPLGIEAEDLIPDISDAEWLVLGPFDNAPPTNGWDECQGYNFDYLQGLGGEEVARPQAGQVTAGRVWAYAQADEGIIDFIRIYGRSANCLAYAYIEVYSSLRQTVALRLGSDDGIKVWANGRLVLNHHIHRSLNPEDEAIHIQLKAGINRLLVKVEQETGGWGFAARFEILAKEEERFLEQSTVGLRLYPAADVVCSSEPILCTVRTKPAAAVKEKVSVALVDAKGGILTEKPGFTGEPIELTPPSGFKGLCFLEAKGEAGLLEGCTAKKNVLIGKVTEITADFIEEAQVITDLVSKSSTFSAPVKKTLITTFNYYQEVLTDKVAPSLADKEIKLRTLGNLVTLTDRVRRHIDEGQAVEMRMATGLRQWAYQSKIDGSNQPYSLYVPADYDLKKAYSLVLCLHGFSGDGFGALQDLLGGYRPNDFIVAAPFGRGDLGYRSIGEADVLDVLQEIQSLYHIDPDRIYLTGWSMGGFGTWRIGQLYPHYFAGISPFSGWTGFSFLSNLCNLPVLVVHGDSDQEVPVYADQLAVGILQEHYQAPIVYHELSGVGHDAWSEWCKQEGSNRLFQYFRNHKRNSWPQSITMTINHLRYAKQYWVEIMEFEAPLNLGHVQAQIVHDRHITVHTKNVAAFSLSLEHPDLAQSGILTVDINQKTVQIKAGQEKAFFCLHAEDSWVAGKKLVKDGIVRNEGGGLSDLFMRPLCIIYGTRQKESTANLKRMAESLADWSGKHDIGFGSKIGKFRVKADTEVTKDELKNCNLLLLGSPAENGIIKMIEADLPTKWVKEGIQIEGKVYPDAGFTLVYPNPLSPQNLIGVISLPFDPSYNELLVRQLSLIIRAYGTRGEDATGINTPDLMVFTTPSQIGETACFDLRWEQLIYLH